MGACGRAYIKKDWICKIFHGGSSHFSITLTWLKSIQGVIKQENKGQDWSCFQVLYEKRIRWHLTFQPSFFTIKNPLLLTQILQQTFFSARALWAIKEKYFHFVGRCDMKSRDFHQPSLSLSLPGYFQTVFHIWLLLSIIRDMQNAFFFLTCAWFHLKQLKGVRKHLLSGIYQTQSVFCR